MNKQKQKQNIFKEYYLLSNNTKYCSDVSIDLKTFIKIHNTCKDKFDSNWIIKEYSIYKHKDKEFYIYPEGSNYCYEIDKKKEECEDISNNFMIIRNIQCKIRNDYFEPEYMYESNIDIIEIRYIYNKNITIILRTNYENTFDNKYVKLSMLSDIVKSNKCWSEVLIRVYNDESVETINKALELINSP